MFSADSVPAQIGVVLASEVRLYREGIASALSSHGRLRIVATPGNRPDAAAAVRTLQPEVVIVDMSMAGALELTAELRALSPSLRIVAMAVREDIAAISECARACADGFVTVNASMVELVGAIERALAGELLCTPRIAAELFHSMRAQPERRGPGLPNGATLTIREEQVLSFLARGLSNKEIGSSLHISEATVKSHVHHLLEKLQVSSRAQAMVHAIRPDNVLRVTGYGAAPALTLTPFTSKAPR